LNNSPEHIEAHFGIPMTGAVLNPLNYRLDARTLTFMLGHAEAKILIVDREYSKLVSSVLATFPPEKRPFIIDVDDPLCYLVSKNLKTIAFQERSRELNRDLQLFFKESVEYQVIIPLVKVL